MICVFPLTEPIEPTVFDPPFLEPLAIRAGSSIPDRLAIDFRDMPNAGSIAEENYLSGVRQFLEGNVLVADELMGVRQKRFAQAHAGAQHDGVGGGRDPIPFGAHHHEIRYRGIGNRSACRTEQPESPLAIAACLSV